MDGIQDQQVPYIKSNVSERHVFFLRITRDQITNKQHLDIRKLLFITVLLS